MERIIFDVQELLKRAEHASDPRTQDWLFVRSISSPLFAICVYVTMVIVGPRIMKGRQAFCLRNTMAVYNFAAVLLTAYVFFKLLFMVISANYSYLCEPVDHTFGNAKQLEIARLIWCYYISKYFEMVDTLFFILRKKENQISFLHVYHHSSVLIIWWLASKWFAGGSTFVPATINSFVHIVMYTYYGLSTFPSLKKYLWWKRYLTQIQLIQFCTLVIHSVVILFVKCGYPYQMTSICLAYSLSLLLLFGKFYFQSYTEAKRQKSEINHANENQIQQNGNNLKKSS